MAHILTIIPNVSRMGKKVQTLSCMKDEEINILKRFDCAAKVRQQLETDAFELNNKRKRNTLIK